MKTRSIFLWVCVLVVIDQGIKIIINNFFLDYNFEIIPSLLEFKPVFNQKYSYVNDSLYRWFNFDLGLLFHLILFILIAIMVTVICDYYSSIKKSKLLDFSLVFFIAGMLCALSGMLIWEKGVLDFIYLKPLFVFDLKDMYVNCYLFLLLLYVLKNRHILHNIKMKDVMIHVKKRLKINAPK